MIFGIEVGEVDASSVLQISLCITLQDTGYNVHVH